MGESHNRQAVDGLSSLLLVANHNLSLVHHKLDKEFARLYPDSANPMKLVARIKKVEEDVSSLKNECREILTAKQDLIDKTKSLLVGNRNLLQRMQNSVGILSNTDSGDDAYDNFNQVIDEWTAQVRARTGDVGDNGVHDSNTEDINQLFFSGVIQ